MNANYSSSHYEGTAVEIAKDFEIEHPDLEFSLDEVYETATLTKDDQRFVVGTEYTEPDEDGNTEVDGYTYSTYAGDDGDLDPLTEDGDSDLSTLKDALDDWYAAL